MESRPKEKKDAVRTRYERRGKRRSTAPPNGSLPGVGGQDGGKRSRAGDAEATYPHCAVAAADSLEGAVEATG
jgi:hypothetical protein